MEKGKKKQFHVAFRWPSGGVHLAFDNSMEGLALYLVHRRAGSVWAGGVERTCTWRVKLS
jgi:hypothetical protein